MVKEKKRTRMRKTSILLLIIIVLSNWYLQHSSAMLRIFYVKIAEQMEYDKF